MTNNRIAAVWRGMPTADKACGLAFILGAPALMLALMVVLP